MINTQMSASNMATKNDFNKLELIKLVAKDEFISNNLNSTIAFVKQTIKDRQFNPFNPDDTIICQTGLNSEGELLLFNGMTTKDCLSAGGRLFAGTLMFFKNNTNNYYKVAQQLLTDYYQHCFKLRNKQQSFTGKQINDFLNQTIGDIFTDKTMIDCLFTPRAYIDYLLGQCQVPLTTEAKEILKTACEEYISYEVTYFYLQILNNPNIGILIKDVDFANLVSRVLYYNTTATDRQTNKSLHLIDTILTKAERQND